VLSVTSVRVPAMCAVSWFVRVRAGSFYPSLYKV
jgi:hypothetical protein